MPHPPWGDVWDLTRLVLIPSLLAALLVFLPLRYFAGERFTPLPAALALFLGVLVANHFREVYTWKFDPDRPFTAKDFRHVLGETLEPATSTETKEGAEEPPPRQSPRYWLPWLTALAVVVELLLGLPRVPVSLGWIVRTLVAVLAGRLLTPADVRVEMPWVSWALALVILWGWALLTHLAREWKDGTVPLGLALCCNGAAVLILYAGSGSLVDWPMLLLAPLLVIAGVTWRWPGDTGPALAGLAVFLPGLLLNAQQETFSKLTWDTFALVGVAPLALTLFLIPALLRLTGWKRWALGVGLPLVPVAVAVGLAARLETLPF